MKLIVEMIGGRWTVNGKKMNELNSQERDVLNRFFIDNKITDNEQREN